MVTSELDEAIRSANELARIATQHQVPEFSLTAELACGRIDSWKGNLKKAAQIFAHFLEEIDRAPIKWREGTLGVLPPVSGFALCGLASWFLGRPDHARVIAGRGLVYAEEKGHPLSIASALVHSAHLELLCGNWKVVADLAARATQISATHGLSFHAPLARFWGGA